jgi:hypothetical protein
MRALAAMQSHLRGPIRFAGRAFRPSNPAPQPAADEVLIRVAASSINPLEYKLADLNFMGRTPPSFLASTFPASSSQRAMTCAAWLSVTRWPLWRI